MVKTHNRIIAGALSTLMIGQIALFGDGTTKGMVPLGTWLMEMLRYPMLRKLVSKPFSTSLSGE